MSWLRAIVPALLILLAGCGYAVTGAPGPAQVSTLPGLPPADPVELGIEAIDASSTLVPLGLNPDQTIEVPPVQTPMEAGWYTHGPTPGELGPAVILGHLNGGGQDGIFADLVEMAPGDEIVVRRDDGRTAVFTTTRVDQVPKTDFPTDAVYGDTEAPELRLITCGGTFDKDRRSYRDNIIVYAVLTAVR